MPTDTNISIVPAADLQVYIDLRNMGFSELEIADLLAAMAKFDNVRAKDLAAK